MAPFSLARVTSGVVEIFLLAQSEINLDRIHRRNGGQRATVGIVGLDQVADLSLRDARDAINRRNDPGEAEIELGCLDGGPGCLNRSLGRLDPGFGRHNRRLRRLDSSVSRFDLRLGHEIGLDGVIEFLVSNGLLLGERSVAIHIELGFALIGLGLCALRL